MKNNRAQIAAYYTVRMALRSMAPHGHRAMRAASDPVMGEVGHGIFRAYIRLAEQKIKLGLNPELSPELSPARPALRFTKYDSGNEMAVEKNRPDVIGQHSPATVSGVAECFSSHIYDVISGKTLPVQRHWEKLVSDKGIHKAVGRCDVETARGTQSFYGHYVILAARELRQGWLGDKGLRAFRVAATPSRYLQQQKSCVAYVVKSNLSDDITPAISGELRKAVSLAERRIRAKVLENMET